MTETVREIWKPLNKFKGYEVSNFGSVRKMGYKLIYDDGSSDRVEPQLLPSYNADGYVCVTINNRTCPVHRLVASEFIDNPNKYPYVRHVDRDRLNNHSDNLIWVSASDSAKLAIEEGKKSKPSPYRGVTIVCKESGEKYSSIGEFAKHFHISRIKATKYINNGIELNGSVYERLNNKN